MSKYIFKYDQSYLWSLSFINFYNTILKSLRYKNNYLCITQYLKRENWLILVNFFPTIFLIIPPHNCGIYNDKIEKV